MLLQRTFAAISLVLLWGTAHAGPGKVELIGKWKMESSSIQFPDTCKSMTFQFLADGSYIGNDGSMEMTMKYDISEDGEGLALNFLPGISDNGRPNCQGMPPQFVRQHPIRKALVRFVDNERVIRFYFGPTKLSPYLTLIRQD